MDIIVSFALAIFLVLLTITALTHVFSGVPYVPSRKRVIQKMLELAKLKAGETVYDLGCGDGRILFTAERQKGIRGIGVEIAILPFLAASLWKWISQSKVVFRFQNLFKTNLGNADVIFCYLIPDVMPAVSEKLKRECRSGTRIVSNTFHIPGLTPTKVLHKDPIAGTPTIYLYRFTNPKRTMKKKRTIQRG